MIKDFITIQDSTFRVEINMDTIERWELLSMKCLSEFENAAVQAAKIAKGVSTLDMFMWLYVSIKEGESLEGREFKYTVKEFRKMVRPATFALFSPIFIKQYMGEAEEEPKSPTQKKRKRRWWRRLLFLKSEIK